MPLPYGMGQRVDGDPVAGLARGAAQELPGPLGLGGERPLEEAEGEPAGLELGSRKSRSATNSSGVGRSPRVALRKPRCDGGEERPADAVDGADARRDALLAGEVVGIGERRRGRAVSAVANASGSLMSSARRRAERLGRVAVCGDERDGAGGRLARGRRRRHDRGRWSTRSRSSQPRPAARPAEAVAVLEVALAVRVGGDVDAGRGRELGAGRGVDDPCPAVSTIRATCSA